MAIDIAKCTASVKAIRDHFADEKHQESTGVIRDEFDAVLATSTNRFSILSMVLNTGVDGTPAYEIIFGQGDKALFDIIVKHFQRFKGNISEKFFKILSENAHKYADALRGNKKPDVAKCAEQLAQYVAMVTQQYQGQQQQLHPDRGKRPAPQDGATVVTLENVPVVDPLSQAWKQVQDGEVGGGRFSPESFQSPSNESNTDKAPQLSPWQQKWIAVKRFVNRYSFEARTAVFFLSVFFIALLFLTPGFAPAFLGALGVTTLITSKAMLFIVGWIASGTWWQCLVGLIAGAATTLVMACAIAGLDVVMARIVWGVGMMLKGLFSGLGVLISGIGYGLGWIMVQPGVIGIIGRAFLHIPAVILQIPVALTLALIQVGEKIRQLAWRIHEKWPEMDKHGLDAVKCTPTRANSDLAQHWMKIKANPLTLLTNPEMVLATALRATKALGGETISCTKNTNDIGPRPTR